MLLLIPLDFRLAQGCAAAGAARASPPHPSRVSRLKPCPCSQAHSSAPSHTTPHRYPTFQVALCGLARSIALVLIRTPSHRPTWFQRPPPAPTRLYNVWGHSVDVFATLRGQHHRQRALARPLLGITAPRTRTISSRRPVTAAPARTRRARAQCPSTCRRCPLSISSAHSCMRAEPLVTGTRLSSASRTFAVPCSLTRCSGTPILDFKSSVRQFEVLRTCASQTRCACSLMQLGAR